MRPGFRYKRTPSGLADNVILRHQHLQRLLARDAADAKFVAELLLRRHPLSDLIDSLVNALAQRLKYLLIHRLR
ncbi:hypothetical protein D3C75_1168270 [compost metagenome]